MDLVVIGHVTVDEVDGGTRPGGAAFYAAVTASRLGLEVGLLTSYGPTIRLDWLPAGIEVVERAVGSQHGVPAGRSAAQRTLTLLGARGRHRGDASAGRVARGAAGAPVPRGQRGGPGAWRPASPRRRSGCCRRAGCAARGAGGAVTPQTWDDADLVLPHVQSLVVSTEDIAPFEKDALEWFQRVPVGVVTRGSRGATLFVNGDRVSRRAGPRGRGRCDRGGRCVRHDSAHRVPARRQPVGCGGGRGVRGCRVRRGAGAAAHSRPRGARRPRPRLSPPAGRRLNGPRRPADGGRATDGEHTHDTHHRGIGVDGGDARRLGHGGRRLGRLAAVDRRADLGRRDLFRHPGHRRRPRRRARRSTWGISRTGRPARRSASSSARRR